MTRFASWCGNVIIGLIVVGAILIAVISYNATATLYTTGAAYGGQSTRLTLDAIQTYFANVKPKAAATPKCDPGKKVNPKTGVCA